MGWIFTNLLALMGTSYGWINPFFGLMVYYAFAILRPTHLWFWFTWPTYRYSFYVAVATLLGWLFRGLGDWSAVRMVWWPIAGMWLYLLGGFLGWQFNAINPERAWDFYYPQLTVGIMMLAALTLIRSEKQLHAFVWVIIVSLGYLAYNFNMQYRDAPLYLYLRGFGGIDNNGVAMVMVMGVPLAFFLGVCARSVWVKLMCFFFAAALIHVVLFTYSRGAQLGLCMVGGMIFTFAMVALPNKGLTMLAAVAGLLLTLRLAGENVRKEFFSIFVDSNQLDASAASRFDTWRAAWRCMLDYPMGLGPRNFNLVSQNYGLSPGKSVHNLFLQTGADYGFLGAMGLILFYLGTMWLTFQMTRTRTAKRLVWPAYYGYMVCISLAGFVVCSTFIGMESVEVAFIISIAGLLTVAHVRRVAAAEPLFESGRLPELEEVPPSDTDPHLTGELRPA